MKRSLFSLLFLTITALIAMLFSSCSQFMPLRDGSAASPAPSTGSPATSRVQANIIRYARAYTGTPYQHGGTSHKGMDCSGLVYTAFKQAGIAFPRATTDQADRGRMVALHSIRPGDLVFFNTDHKNPRRISHVGIVTVCRGMDDIRFIHAANSGVREDNLFSDYYRKSFARAVRPMLTP